MENVERQDAVPEKLSVGADQGALRWSDVRLPALLIALCICGFVFLRLLPSDPLLYRAFAHVLGQKSEKSPEEMLFSLRMKDPPLGAILPLPENAVFQSDVNKQKADGRAARTGHVLVFMAGSCSTCVLQHLRSVDSWRAQHPAVRVIAVSFTPETEIARFRQEYQLTLPIISDTERTLSDQYNAAWTPRAYLLTPTGTLLWKQDQMHFDIGQAEQALETARKGTNKR